MASVLDRELLIVTGKGGTGKSTIAAGLAWAAAERGKRVLAVGLDATGELDACLVGIPQRPLPPVGYKPVERRPRLWSMVMDPEESLKEYLRIFLKLPVVTRIGVLSNVFDFVANAAPGVREIVTIGKFTYEVRERHYDLVVVDATATGHVLGQLDAPDAINELVGAGLIRSQTGWMRDILTDPARTGVVAVTTAEEMPVVETIELTQRLRDKVHVDLAAVVVNRVRDEPLSKGDWALLERTMAADPGLLNELAGHDVSTLIQSSRNIAQQRRASEPFVQQLIAALPEVSMVFVPWLMNASPGPATTAEIAELLAEELGFGSVS
jgi:anion-transporting  ArsA/GET3 family ATPase